MGYEDLPWSRQRVQSLRNEATGGSPGSGDDPLGTHTVMAQMSMVENLRELIARQEAGEKNTSGLQGELSIEIDPAISYGENVARIKQAGDGSGFESNERNKRRAQRGKAEGEAREAAIDYLVDECMRLEEEDATDGVDALRIAGDGRAPPVPGGEQLLDDVNSITDEFGFTALTDAISRCQEMTMPDRGIEPGSAGVAEDQLLDQFDAILGQRPVSVDAGFEAVQDRIDSERAEARQNFLNRLSVAFSSSFADVDDAIETIRDRVDTLAQLDVRSGDVELVGRRDAPPFVSMEAGFSDFSDAVSEQYESAVDLTAAEARIRTGRIDAGSVRVINDELQVIDLSPLIDDDRFRVTNPDALVRRFETAVQLPATEPEVDPNDAQTPTEPAESEGDRLADDALEGVYVE